jgi:hypothetical protein
VATLDSTLLNDFEECLRVIDDAKSSINDIGSFLSYDFLSPFLDGAEAVVTRYLATMQARFATHIEQRGGGISQILLKRYPLSETGREIRVYVPLRNSGPGLATDIRISATAMGENVRISENPIMLGNVAPGDFAAVLDAKIVEPVGEFDGALSVEWGEIGSGVRKDEVFEFKVLAQTSAVDWSSLEYWSPYNIGGPAEGSEFIGRSEKIKLITNNILRSPMESFYITGQKRVGKTSLIKAAAEAVCSRAPDIHYTYILWGTIAHVDPATSLRLLGENIEEFIREAIHPGSVIEPGKYDGSLSNLVRLSNAALKTNPTEKFLIIIDEFDEIHQELYLQGNLAETFFANLRAISRCRNICLALVGGENMPYVMERQGQKLNNFARINLTYYSRQAAELEDFQLLVRKPSEGILSWHEEAVSEVFNNSAGNPYFAKIICGQAARNAVSERDGDVTAGEVKRAIEAQVSSLGANFFAHLWQDGIPKPLMERETDVSRRMRVLVALARCLRRRIEPTAANIAENRASNALPEGQVTPVLHDFVRREVLYLNEQTGTYELVLPIFRLWLLDVGVSQLVSDKMSEELAQSALIDENAAIVRSEEVVSLAKKWPTYRGKHIGTDEIRAWLQQVPSARDQRILFKILEKTKVYSEPRIRELLRAAHSLLRASLPEFVQKTRNQHRRDVLLTYVDGPGKSGATCASLYAEENGINQDCVIVPEGFEIRFYEHKQKAGNIAALVIVDDIAGTGGTLSEKVVTFLNMHGRLLSGVKIRIITLVSTPEAQAKVLRSLERFEELDLDFRCCEILGREAIAFPDDDQWSWSSRDEFERARALCIDLGSRIYKQSPLGFGGMGLLVVFPATVPNNTLPILHSCSRANSGESWIPLFLRPIK